LTDPLNKKPELLAPAGSLEAFFAALDHGADAVYCGLQQFSARAKAKNFSLESLAQAVGYARERGRKVFVTLNTLVKERELSLLANTLGALEEMGVDGIILQDLAVWRLARRHFPGLALHASTQMTIHNTAGVRMLEKLGFTRAVLARELSLEEISVIRHRTSLELEHFIHGALCFSFSGQCTFSSWMGGKSGNRGCCAQPCRRRYRSRRGDGYYFSTNDLSALDLLPELTAAGVSSFKIEGRMKSAEYVAQVVSAYRMALDADANGRLEAVRRAKELLKESFGRPPTRGFLPGGIPADIAIPSQSGATGRYFGQVAAVKGDRLLFQTRDVLQLGDRLRIQPRSDKAGSAFTVKDMAVGNRPVKTVAAGRMVSVAVPFPERLKNGDAIYKVSSSQAFSMSETACRRRLAGTAAVPEAVLLTAVMPDATTLKLSARAGTTVLERTCPVDSFPAVDRPLTAEVLNEVFRRTGDKGLELAELTTGPLPAVVIPPSQLKALRRDFYRDLLRELTEGRRERRHRHTAAALGSLIPPILVPSPDTRSVTIGIGQLRDLHILNDETVDRVLIPLEAASGAELNRLEGKLKNRRERVIWDLPFILFDGEWEEAQAVIKGLVGRGYRAFRLNNLGHWPLFEGLGDLQLTAGFRLFSLNSQAAAAWAELGAEEATLYPEDDRDNLGELLKRQSVIRMSLEVYGSVPMLTSRIPVRGLKSGEEVTGDTGDRFRVWQRQGLTVLTPERDFSLLGRLRELGGMGCGRFLVDLTHLGPFSPAGKKVLAALHRDTEVPGTSHFNYQLGME